MTEKEELASRRAAAVLIHNILANYHLRYTGPALSEIELLDLNGQSTGIFIPVKHSGESI